MKRQKGLTPKKMNSLLKFTKCSQTRKPPAGNTKFQCCLCVCVFFTLTKPTGKNPAMDFSCWIVRREGHETKGCPLRCSSRRPTSQAAPQETELCVYAGIPRASPTATARAVQDRVTCPPTCSATAHFAQDMLWEAFVQ